LLADKGYDADAINSDYGWAFVSTELERRARNRSRFVRVHPERIR
jgi:hypothetical protein